HRRRAGPTGHRRRTPGRPGRSGRARSRRGARRTPWSHPHRSVARAVGRREAGVYLGPMADRSPLGLLDTDWLVDEEDRAIQQTVRKFVDDRIRPNIAEWY